jgi:hypothetical protein
MLRMLSHLCFVTGLGLFAWAGWEYFSQPSQPGVLVAEEEQTLNSLRPDQQVEVVYYFENTSSQKVKVFNFAEC